mgnify:CR=1 FL=1
MNDDRLLFGSGVEVFSFDLENKKYSVEFDLTEGEFNKCNPNLNEGISFMNPASTFRFIASGYYLNYVLIRDEIEKLFEDKEKYKKIPYLIFPLFFSFRHFAELKLKSVYLDLFMKKPNKLNHDLLTLIKEFKKNLGEIENADVKDNLMEDVIRNVEFLIQSFSEFARIEPKSDYYRFYLDRNLKIEKLKVELDFDRHINLMQDITIQISELYKNVMNSL